MSHIQSGELQLLAIQLLRSNNVELGDDPRTEVEVAIALGYLTLDKELTARAKLPELTMTEVY